MPLRYSQMTRRKKEQNAQEERIRLEKLTRKLEKLEDELKLAKEEYEKEKKERRKEQKRLRRRKLVNARLRRFVDKFNNIEEILARVHLAEFASTVLNEIELCKVEGTIEDFKKACQITTPELALLESELNALRNDASACDLPEHLRIIHFLQKILDEKQQSRLIRS